MLLPLRIIATVGAPTKGKRDSVTYTPGRPSPAEVEGLSERLECGALLPVESLEHLDRRPEARSRLSGRRRMVSSWLVLSLPGNRGARMRLGLAGSHLVKMVKSGAAGGRRPGPAHVALTVLTELGIEFGAAALLRRRRPGVEAAVVLRRDGREVTLPADGAVAVALALAAEGPLLMTEGLAEKLYVLGKNGRPITPRSVRKRLRSKAK